MDEVYNSYSMINWYLQHNSAAYNIKWFTLAELMIVVSILMTLMWLVLFPYTYYMQRAYVENSIDTVWQKWILAHKDIRNGKLYDVNISANKILVFKKWEGTVKQYLFSWGLIPNLGTISSNPSVKVESPIQFESSIEILGFSGAWLDNDSLVWYYIEAPYGSGAFFTGSNLISSTGILLTIGYSWAELTSGRARQIILKPYLQ